MNPETTKQFNRKLRATRMNVFKPTIAILCIVLFSCCLSVNGSELSEPVQAKASPDQAVAKAVSQVVESYLKERETSPKLLPLSSMAASDAEEKQSSEKPFLKPTILEKLIFRIVTAIRSNFPDATKLHTFAAFETGDLANELLVLQALFELGFKKISNIVIFDQKYLPKIFLPKKEITPNFLTTIPSSAPLETSRGLHGALGESTVFPVLASHGTFSRDLEEPPQLAARVLHNVVEVFEARVRKMFPDVHVNVFQTLEQYSFACSKPQKDFPNVPKAQLILWINPQGMVLKGKEKEALDISIEKLKKEDPTLAQLNFTKPSLANAQKDAVIVEAKFATVIAYRFPMPSRKMLLPLFDLGFKQDFALWSDPQNKEFLQKVLKESIEKFSDLRLKLIRELADQDRPNFESLTQFLVEQVVPARRELQNQIKTLETQQARTLPKS